MKKQSRTYLMYLQDIQLSMNRIAEYLSGFDFDQFKADNRTVDAVVRNFEIIGEASKNIPAEVKLKYPEVPWAEMYYMRNRISHEYFGVDLMILWDIASNHLPHNALQIKKILETEK